MKKVFRILLVLLILLILGGLAWFFLIGEPVDGDQLVYTIDYDGQTMILDIHSPDSGIALRDWDYRLERRILYITARKVPVTPFFSSGSFHDEIAIGNTQEIYLGNRLIWSAK